MANEGSTRMTTDQLRAMIAGGASRDDLPTKAKGSSVSSTRDSAQRAYLAAQQKAQRTADFRAAQQQTAREASRERTAQMISISENSSVMPNDAQTQKPVERVNYSDSSKYVVHGANEVSNNVVNPASLYTNQPVNVTGQGQNSTMNYGINTNANYNYATAMNDFMTANPASEINLGQSAQKYGYTAGLSSVPKDNDVKTSLLGGDMQHQETDVNTNTTRRNYDFRQADPIALRTWGLVSSGTLAAAGLAVLFLLGRKK